MGNKHFSDVKPNRDDKDSAKAGIKSDAKTKPVTNPTGASCAGPTHARGGAPVKAGGKDLAAPKFVEKLHREPAAPLPKNGK